MLKTFEVHLKGDHPARDVFIVPGEGMTVREGCMLIVGVDSRPVFLAPLTSLLCVREVAFEGASDATNNDI